MNVCDSRVIRIQDADEEELKRIEAEIRRHIGGRLPGGELYVGGYMKLKKRERESLRRQGGFLRSRRKAYNRSEEEVASAIGVSVDLLVSLEEGLVPEDDWPTDFVYNYSCALGDMGVLDVYAQIFHAPRYLRRKLSEDREL